MKRKEKRPKPTRSPGPVTNRRKANKPLKPASGRSFLERSVHDGPEDVTAFDAAPTPEDADTGGSDE